MQQHLAGRLVLLLVMASIAVSPLLASLPGARVTGTVIEVEEDDKRFVLREAGGQRHELRWNRGTAMLTRPQEGLRMRVHYVTDDEGRKVARRIGKADKPSRR